MDEGKEGRKGKLKKNTNTRLSWQWLCRMLPPGTWCRVVWYIYWRFIETYCLHLQSRYVEGEDKEEDT